MPLETEIRQHIDCDTFEECKEKLFKLYGQNYKIEKKDTILKNVGFLGLRQKEITRVYYTVPHANNYNDAQQIQIQLDSRKKEAELLEKNRQEIIQKNSTYMMCAAGKDGLSRVKKTEVRDEQVHQGDDQGCVGRRNAGRGADGLLPVELRQEGRRTDRQQAEGRGHVQ